MNKTESVSIGRHSFVCEQDAYSMLQKYLDRAGKTLVGDPDKDEILADLELSMAGHLQELSGDLVVDLKTAKAVIEQMGEIETHDESEKSHADKNTKDETWQDRLANMLKKPLRKDHEHEIIDGVCAGLARMFEVDPVWIRLAFVLLTLLTSGVWIIVYIVLLILMQDDSAPNKRSAQDVVETVKDKVAVGIEQAKPYERALRSFFGGLWKFIGFCVSLTMLLLLLSVAVAWSSVLFIFFTEPAKLVVFGSSPTLASGIFLVSFGVAIILPMLLLIAGLTNPSSLKNTRINIVVWSAWLLAVIAASGAGISIASEVRQRLITEQPNTEHISVQVENGEIESACVSLWGDCKRKQVNYSL